jgi:hypothetical protein
LIIDVACNRLGDVIGGGITLLLLAIIPFLPLAVPLTIAALGGFAALAFSPKKLCMR